MEYITIDFKTVNTQRDNSGEISLSFVKNDEIVDSKYWLIRPKYDKFAYFNLLLNVIRPEHISAEIEFEKLCTEISSLLENKLFIDEHVDFDIAVLQQIMGISSAGSKTEIRLQLYLP